MKERTALIWDLDGTLLDSYPAILRALMRLLERYHYHMDETEVLAAIKRTAVRDFLISLEGKVDADPAVLWASFHELKREEDPAVPAMGGAVETLRALSDRSVENYLFTHASAAAWELLRHVGLAPYLLDAVTSDSGLPRKPAPDGILYLMDKHGLPRERTFYVGDRDLDVQCARNAGVGSILLTGPWRTLRADFEVSELIQILSLPI